MWFHLSSILNAGAVPFQLQCAPEEPVQPVPSHCCWLALVWLAVGGGAWRFYVSSVYVVGSHVNCPPRDEGAIQMGLHVVLR